jgi:hypothetical protein
MQNVGRVRSGGLRAGLMCASVLLFWALVAFRSLAVAAVALADGGGEGESLVQCRTLDRSMQSARSASNPSSSEGGHASRHERPLGIPSERPHRDGAGA